MIVSLTVCPICAAIGWKRGDVELLGAVTASVRTNKSLPVLASWRCANFHEWNTLVVVSKLEKEME